MGTIRGRVLVLYATREGQTRRIAEHVGAAFRARGFGGDVHNVAALPRAFSLAPYDAAVLAASVHVGRHEPEMVAFVRGHRPELARLTGRTAFLSVSAAEATAEDRAAREDARVQSAANAKKAVDAFFDATGWRPAHVFPVAGALRYLDYNPLIRFVIRTMARRAGTRVDTTRNTEYTDWEALDRVVEDLVGEWSGSPAEGLAF